MLPPGATGTRTFMGRVGNKFDCANPIEPFKVVKIKINLYKKFIIINIIYYLSLHHRGDLNIYLPRVFHGE